MRSSERPHRPTGTEGTRRLPDTLEEFRLVLRRRIELLEREIRALGSGDQDDVGVDALEPLARATKELKQRLAVVVETESWPEIRIELIVMCRSCRHDFEQLATARQRWYSVRSGQRERGPRW